MRYVKKFFTGVGLSVVLLLAWWYFVGANEIFQHYNNVDTFFYVTAAVIIAVVAFIFVAIDIGAAIIVFNAIVFMAIALNSPFNEVAGFNFGFSIFIFLILLAFGLVEYYIASQIKNKKLNKNYWIVYNTVALLFTIGVYCTPIILS